MTLEQGRASSARADRAADDASSGRSANAQTTRGNSSWLRSDRHDRIGGNRRKFPRTAVLLPQLPISSTTNPDPSSKRRIPSSVKRQKSYGVGCTLMRKGVLTMTRPPGRHRSCNVRVARHGSGTCSSTCSQITRSCTSSAAGGSHRSSCGYADDENSRHGCPRCDVPLISITLVCSGPSARMCSVICPFMTMRHHWSVGPPSR